MITKDNLILGLAIGAIVFTAGLIFASGENAPFNFKILSAVREQDQSVGQLKEQANQGRTGVPGQFIPARDMTCSDVNKTATPQLEAYVVSQCPFGLQMQRVLAEIVKNDSPLASQIKVRYIGAISNGQLTSMHGLKEAQENLRQICVREEYSNKYWDYIFCHIEKGDSDSCLSASGISPSDINKCMADPTRGIKYAKEDTDLTAKYGIQGSPTLVINGQEVSEYNFGGRNPNAVKEVLCCGFNDRPEACSVQLNKTDPATAYSETYLKQPKK